MPQNLDAGFVMRHATAADKEAIESMVRTVFGKAIGPIVDRLFVYHPDSPLTDHFLIMDTKNNKVAAYFCLSRSTCVFNGVEFPVGHMELVSTLPEYRHQGFIRHLNTLFEQRVEEYQLPLLVIIGIPYFYRTFGYEYGITFGGTLTVPMELIPALKKDEDEPIIIEETTQETFDQYLTARQYRNSYLDFYRRITPTEFPYLTHGTLGHEAVYRFYVMKQDSKVVGSFMISVGWGFVQVDELWVDNLTHIPSMLRFVKMVAKRRRLPIRIYMPSRPAIQLVLEELSRSKFSKPYAWYVRIPSVKRFLDTITPVLENRLAGSEFGQLSDSLRVGWYRGGVEIRFKEGKVTDITEIKRENLQNMDVTIPFPVIYQLLMGYMTIDELQQIYPDANAPAIKCALVQSLFPKIRAQLTPDF